MQRVELLRIRFQHPNLEDLSAKSSLKLPFLLAEPAFKYFVRSCRLT